MTAENFEIFYYSTRCQKVSLRSKIFLQTEVHLFASPSRQDYNMILSSIMSFTCC